MTNLLDAKIRHKDDGTPILSKAEIERHARDYLAQYGRDTRMYDLRTLLRLNFVQGSNARSGKSSTMATPIEEIIEEHCKIELRYMDFWDRDVLGVTVFASGIIEVR